MKPTIVNALTVDVEDWFQVSAFDRVIARESWDGLPCRVERNVDRLLELFDANGARATFFTLGWIAERYPQLVKRIVRHGHELASHGYGHRRATELTPHEFEQDVLLAKRVLEDLGGTPVQGYRAPSFSIDKRNPWAFDALVRAGYIYSSSVYPVKHDHYGVPDAPRFPYRTSSGLIEVPITTLRMLGRNWPAGGGGYFRLAPYALSRWVIAKFNRDEAAPAIFYCHPWEIDADQPRMRDVPMRTRFRHYVNLKRTQRRLERLLADFRWDRVDRAFDLDAAHASTQAQSESGMPARTETVS